MKARFCGRGVRAAIVGPAQRRKIEPVKPVARPRSRDCLDGARHHVVGVIQETANIRGLPVVFIDTAGLRDAGDEIEQEGVRRSRRTAEQAEVLLHVLDASETSDVRRRGLSARVFWTPPITGFEQVRPGSKAGRAYFRTQEPHAGADTIETSCLTGAGIENLKDALKELVWSGEIRTETLEVMINSRH